MIGCQLRKTAWEWVQAPAGGYDRRTGQDEREGATLPFTLDAGHQWGIPAGRKLRGRPVAAQGRESGLSPRQRMSCGCRCGGSRGRSPARCPDCDPTPWETLAPTAYPQPGEFRRDAFAGAYAALRGCVPNPLSLRERVGVRRPPALAGMRVAGLACVLKARLPCHTPSRRGRPRAWTGIPLIDGCRLRDEARSRGAGCFGDGQPAVTEQPGALREGQLLPSSGPGLGEPERSETVLQLLPTTLPVQQAVSHGPDHQFLL